MFIAHLCVCVFFGIFVENNLSTACYMWDVNERRVRWEGGNLLNCHDEHIWFVIIHGDTFNLMWLRNRGKLRLQNRGCCYPRRPGYLCFIFPSQCWKTVYQIFSLPFFLRNKVVKLVTDPIKCAVRLRRFNYLWWLGYKKKRWIMWIVHLKGWNTFNHIKTLAKKNHTKDKLTRRVRVTGRWQWSVK